MAAAGRPDPFRSRAGRSDAKTFSVAHHITGSAVWTAALVMMALADVLTRLAVVWMRGRWLTATAAPAAAAPAQAGSATIPAGNRLT